MTKEKFILRNVAAIAVCLVVVAGFISCKKSVTGVTLNKTTLTLTRGETETLTATVSPDNADNKAMNWESNNPAVATVMSNGLITALSKGTATIVVSTQDGGKTASCVVTVILPPHPAEPEMVLVEGGTFTMGCTDGDCEGNRELPAHQVTLNSFKMAKYPVTQKQWVAIMGANPSDFEGDNLPVENVSWDDAQEFIRRLNDSTGKQYRLPTEAEWEYAARGGNKGKDNNHKYSGGNDVDSVGWYVANSNSQTHPVGMKQPNELGIYDMSGNVLEWCSDGYDENYYSISPSNNPQGPSNSSYRVLRGGDYTRAMSNLRVAKRGWDIPNRNFSYFGFRLVHP